jgi:hypothetical protein
MWLAFPEFLCALVCAFGIIFDCGRSKYRIEVERSQKTYAARFWTRLLACFVIGLQLQVWTISFGLSGCSCISVNIFEPREGQRLEYWNDGSWWVRSFLLQHLLVRWCRLTIGLGHWTHLVSLFKLATLSRLGLDSGHEVGRLEFGTDWNVLVVTGAV